MQVPVKTSDPAAASMASKGYSAKLPNYLKYTVVVVDLVNKKKFSEILGCFKALKQVVP